jgi:hypothetical protein
VGLVWVRLRLQLRIDSGAIRRCWLRGGAGAGPGRSPTLLGCGGSTSAFSVAARRSIRPFCAAPFSAADIFPSARAGNRRFRLLSALCAYTKAPYKMDSYRKTLRALNRPKAARTVQSLLQPCGLSRVFPAGRVSHSRTSPRSDSPAGSGSGSTGFTWSAQGRVRQSSPCLPLFVLDLAGLALLCCRLGSVRGAGLMSASS